MTRFRDWPSRGLWKTSGHCHSPCGSRPSDTASDLLLYALLYAQTRKSVIEEGDRISARFTYNGTFGKAFTGYQPNSTAVQMGSIDISRVKDGKLIEHRDELDLPEVFQPIGAATVRKV